MGRILSFAIFITVAVALTGLVHYYIWVRLVRDLALPQLAHRALTVLVIVLGLSIPASFWMLSALEPSQAKHVLYVVYTWMGMCLLFVVLLASADLVRLGVFAGSKLLGAPLDQSRWVGLSRILGATVAVTAAVLAVVGLRNGLAAPELREVEIRLDRLPKELSGTTIVQLTDLHVGPTIGRAFIEDVVRRTNAQSPDIVAITGDLVDGSVEHLREHVEPLTRLRAKHGVFFVTGNHEYYSGAEPWTDELERMGIQVLRNARAEIRQGERFFYLAGVDDYSAGRFQGQEPDMAKALAGHDPQQEIVLLAHQPRHAHEAAEQGVGLMLTGHTHGGQMWPWMYFVRLQQPVVSGLNRFGRTQVYVSNGTAYWGPPMRLMAPSEITKVVLRSAD
jgi:hypothetical protein